MLIKAGAEFNRCISGLYTRKREMLKLRERRRRPSLTLTKVGLHCKFVQSLDMPHINADQQFVDFFLKDTYRVGPEFASCFNTANK